MTISNVDKYIANMGSIKIKINATHLNYVNGNAVLYTTNAANNGASSWTDQYPKPQLLHHNKDRDPVGRVTDYRVMNQTNDSGEPQEYIELDVEITDSEAISKVVKGLYYTCSVGSSTTRVRCSACNQVLTEDGLCEHEKGSIEDGKLVYWIIDEIEYRENSFVNNPADPYSRIVDIDIGNGFIPYKDFLDHRETLVNELIVEDNMKLGDKLSTEARNKLSDSAFCGPGRSFPAHDESHVRAGLRLLNRSKFSDSTKAKIKACLYRKGKQYGITPTKDELEAYPNLLTYRIDEAFLADEATSVADFFLENPDKDLPEVEDTNTDENQTEDTTEDNNDTEVTFEDIKKKDKQDIIDYAEILLAKIEKLEKELSDSTKAIKVQKDKEKQLSDEISEKDAILNSKEDEISTLLDDTFRLDEKYKKAIIDNIVDLTGTSDKSEELYEKYNARQIDSLVDTINDLRDNTIIVDDRVEDPTTLSDNKEDKTSSEDVNTDSEDSEKDQISRFFLTK